ncbi:MAG: hypothetical protein FWD71_09735 [Oscillospiraceae bacterium]|nr:hypothetical protein [Oscillospiraceae bacterium]
MNAKKYDLSGAESPDSLKRKETPSFTDRVSIMYLWLKKPLFFTHFSTKRQITPFVLIVLVFWGAKLNPTSLSAVKARCVTYYRFSRYLILSFEKGQTPPFALCILNFWGTKPLQKSTVRTPWHVNR